jgi:hypothetical protein
MPWTRRPEGYWGWLGLSWSVHMLSLLCASRRAVRRGWGRGGLQFFKNWITERNCHCASAGLMSVTVAQATQLEMSSNDHEVSRQLEKVEGQIPGGRILFNSPFLVWHPSLRGSDWVNKLTQVDSVCLQIEDLKFLLKTPFFRVTGQSQLDIAWCLRSR